MIKLAARNLRRHHTRTLISLIAIGFGVVAMLLAGGFIEWIYWAMRQSTIDTGLGHVHVARPGFRDSGYVAPNSYLLDPDSRDLAALRSMPSVRAVDERLIVNGLASHDDITVAFTGLAVDPDADLKIASILPVEGKRLANDSPDGVLLGRGLSEALHAGIGDRVSFVVTLPRGGVNIMEGTVVGTFTTQVKSYDDSAVRIPLALGRKLLRVKGSHEWVAGLDATESTDEVVRALRGTLPSARFEVSSWLELSDFYRKSVALLSRQVDVIAITIGVIIILSISNTLMMNVLERTGEIGTTMAMGRTRRSILLLFITEGIVLGVVGAALGLVVGVLLAQLLSTIGIPMPPPPGRTAGYMAGIRLTPGLAAAAFAVAVISTTIAGLYPAWRAATMPIVDALRHNR